ncbi:hypothetical protein GQ43DRAFT_431694 [Delitschia confertaspora ATCC 74209]|uniref:FAD/NAD(P)-binding domain-containing protein n=1 Tax=Delitschia confertaspora ATCC 74209 TaxID=1513339 RepID=A0A9P4JQP4_9PLEO|nr:hypothetical protein GQ43DRAFT_431694 [Delitschia confertaspora ATCC 74209]
MKTVLIVGAGPAGLVTAKTFLTLAPDKFKVTIFEKKDNIGGMWASNGDNGQEKCSAEMTTNLSRFTVAFSDLDWSSVDLRQANSEPANPLPLFPTARQVEQYLYAYKAKYVPQEIIHRRTQVMNSFREDGKWRVRYEEIKLIPGVGERRVLGEKIFDYVIVATGFFQNPSPAAWRIKPLLTPSLRSEHSEKYHSQIRRQIQHSTEFRTVKELTKGHLLNNQENNIVVIGGSISGSEAAAEAAFQISNARYSPGDTPNWARCKVYHVIAKPFYCLPKYVPTTQSPAPNFLPLDLELYQLGSRLLKGGPIIPSNGLKTQEQAQASHKKMESLVGAQLDVGCPALRYTDEQKKLPPVAGIVDAYPEFVRSGVIVPIRGRAIQVGVEPNAAQTRLFEKGLVMEVESNDAWKQTFPEGSMSLCYWPQEDEVDRWSWYRQNKTSDIHNVVGVINATGFRPGVPWLDEKVTDTLQGHPHKNAHHCTGCARIPYRLRYYSTYDDRFPELAFIGYYEGPYWGVMELQARLTVQRYLSMENGGIPSEPLSSLGLNTNEDKENVNETNAKAKTDEIKQLDEIEILEKIRLAIVRRQPTVPPFWMGDYVGLMEACAREAGLTSQYYDALGTTGPVLPARYGRSGGHSDDDAEKDKTIKDLLEVMDISGDSHRRVVMKAIWRGLQGDWKGWMQDPTRHDDVVSSVFFHPRESTNKKFQHEYLCEKRNVRQGWFPAGPPAKTHFSVWRFNERDAVIEVYRVSSTDHLTASPYTDLKLRLGGRNEDGWVLNGEPAWDLATAVSKVPVEILLVFEGAGVSGWRAQFEGAEGERKGSVIFER